MGQPIRVTGCSSIVSHNSNSSTFSQDSVYSSGSVFRSGSSFSSSGCSGDISSPFTLQRRPLLASSSLSASCLREPETLPLSAAPPRDLGYQRRPSYCLRSPTMVIHVPAIVRADGTHSPRLCYRLRLMCFQEKKSTMTIYSLTVELLSQK